MSEWLEVFRNKQARARGESVFACKSCGARWGYEIGQSERSHTPPNGVCTCELCAGGIASQSYKDGYDKIDWSLWKQKGRKIGEKDGRVRYRF